MKLSLNNAVRSCVALVGLEIAVAAGVVHAQTVPDSYPQQGMLPIGTYSIDKLETIDRASGNVMYHIPLATLPKVGPDAPFQLELIYNSQNLSASYYSQSDVRLGPNQLNQIAVLMGADGGPQAPPPNLGNAFGSGWQYNFGYQLYAEKRAATSCGDLLPSSYKFTRMWFRTPDGARHQLALFGYLDDGNGFFALEPDINVVDSCGPNGSTPTSGPYTYFTTDGTYIKIVIGNPSYGNLSFNYNAYFPDGTVVTSGSVSATEYMTTITDRNGNPTTIDAVTSPQQTTTISNGAGSIGIVTTPSSGNANAYDTITTAGYGQPLTWTVNYGSIVYGGPYGFYYCDSLGDTCPVGGGTPYFCYTAPNCPGLNVNSTVISSIALPSPTGVPLNFQFGYSDVNTQGWGNLNKVVYPSGAVVQYEWFRDGQFLNCCLGNLFLTNPVTQKTETHVDIVDGAAQPPVTDTWTFSYFGAGNCNAMTAPDQGTDLECVYNNTNSSEALAGVIYKSVSPTGIVEEKQWSTNITAYASGEGNPYVATETHSIPATAGGSPIISAATTHTIDQNGNEVVTQEYDWGSYAAIPRNNVGYVAGPPADAPVLKTTVNTYQYPTPQAYTGPNSVSSNSPNAYWYPSSPNLRDLLTVTNLNGVAVTEHTYDGSGNMLEKRQYNSASNNGITTPLTAANAVVEDYTYGAHGDLTSATDANGIPTIYNWDSSGLYLQSKVVNPAQAKGTISRTTTYSFDPATILLTSITDADNNIQTTFGYDSTGRLTSTSEAFGTPYERDHLITYHDDTLRVTVQQDLATKGDLALTSVTAYDQLGRVRLNKQLDQAGQSPDDDSSGIKIQTRYAYGSGASFKLVSNPYEAGSSSAASGETTMGWTLVQADTDGRPVISQSFDGATPPPPFGGNGSTTGIVSTAYTATTYPSFQAVSTLIDQMGNPRDLGTDGLDRLVNITEYPGVTPYNPNGNTYSTSYSYDALDDLISVNQSGQTRSFVYDSLKRTLTTTNPESGTITYRYDPVGNLLTRLDANAILTCYGVLSGTTCNSGYDALNRPTAKTYSDNRTPAVAYSYDNSGQYSKGRVSSVSNSNSTTQYNAYDPLGRVLQSTQVTGVSSFSFNYQYTQSGSLKSITYPSGRQVATSYDAANRVNGVVNAATSNPYVSNVAYTPHGEFSQYSFGNNLWHLKTYNGRLQPSTSMDLINNDLGQQLLSSLFVWGGATNNGNLTDQVDNFGGPGYPTFLTFNHHYVYDGVNRLQSAAESTGWLETFGYDPWGNVCFTPNNQSPQFNVNTPTTCGLYNGNNQRTDQTYDAAGNLTGLLPSLAPITYDAENHQINAGPNSYAYDGDGRRVVKTANGATTIFVYDEAGQLAAEYSNMPNPSPCTTCYLTTDNLGTTRVITDANAQVISRHDFFPFGDEIQAGAWGRDNTWGSAIDGIDEKFTAKERDAETGLDYFGARYYGSSLGRFTGVDPESASASIFDPQRWNAYSYAVNNPNKFVDRDGKFPLLLVSAAVGAGVGAIGGALFDAGAQYLSNGHHLDQIKGREVFGAAVGGFVSGGLAGLTLGILPVPAALTGGYLATSVLVNGGANVVGGLAQRAIDPTATNGPLGDFVAGAIGGAAGTKLAYKITPLVNVKQELTQIMFSPRRSLHPGKVSDLNSRAFNASVKNIVGGSVLGTTVANSFSTFISSLQWFKGTQTCTEAHDDKGNGTGQTCTGGN